MPALSVLAPGRTGEVSLFGVYRYDLQIGAHDEEIELTARSFPLPTFDNHPCFQNSRG